MNSVMERPFPKSTPSVEKCKRLWQVITNEEGSKLFYDEQRKLEEENKKRISK